MTDKLLEQLSALADDELNPREAELLLARMQRDTALRDTWERYHLVGEALRGALPRSHDRDLAARVAASVESETRQPARSLVATRLLANLQPVAGLAVAVSVAMLAVLTLQGPSEPVRYDVVPAAGDPPVTAPLMGVRDAGFSGVRSVELQNQLRSYLLDHSEHSGGSRLRGVMPYVQIAAHDTHPVPSADEDPAAEREPESRD